MSTPPQAPPAHERSSGGPSSRGASKGLQLSLGALAAAGLLVWYGATNLGDGSTFTYYQTLDEFAAAGVDPGERGLRVHGYVANESIERDVEGRQVRFVVQNDPPHAAVQSSDSRLVVVYQSLETPDLFKEGAEVVVEGRLEGAGSEAVFVANNVMAKCPSKFQAELADGKSPPQSQASAQAL